ncbi:hypothetical protein [Microbacterium capsulatum]|uniref:Uncharacterized protein n=1 Tax=Microbacterium capsulatum TaxID=3041921 RepID=A0ABU0XH28_9MICO|nr:hypothetical protein [Microbacterium sp. ASV81]MDQ4213005.1 hypothetical protein [Microbacterium sp. ASV81]
MAVIRRIVLVGLSVLLAVPVALLLMFLGVPLPFAISWILVAAAAVLVLRQSLIDDAGEWPPPLPERVEHGSDVSRLAWAIDPRTGVVGFAFRRRVTALMHRRLNESGVDPDTADAETVDAVLGPGAHAALAARDLHRKEVERILDALENPPGARADRPMAPPTTFHPTEETT